MDNHTKNFQRSNTTANTLTQRIPSEIWFVNIFSLLGISTLAIFGSVNIVSEAIITGVLEWVFCIILALNLLLLKIYTKRWLVPAKVIMMFSVTLPLLFLLTVGGIGGTGVYWYFTYPVLSFLLWQRKMGWLWMAVLFTGVAIMLTLDALEMVELYYLFTEIRQLSVSLIVVAALLYLFRYITDNQQEQLRIQQIDLEKSQHGMQEALRSAKASEKLLQDQTGQLEQEAQGLQDTRRAMTNLLEDIQSEKQRAEHLALDLQKFRLAVDSSSDSIVITDVEGTVLFCNASVERLTGYTQKEVIGTKAGKLWGGLMPKEFYKKMWDTIKVDKKSFSGEIKNHRKNGEEYYSLASISPVLDDAGNVEFFVSIQRDISEEKAVDKAKTEFVSLASHQLRTPLSTINWYAEMLLSDDAGKLNEEQKDYLQEIYRGNQRMVDLVNALLNVSRLELGTFMVEPEDVDMVALCKDIVKDVEPRVFAKKQNLTEEYEELKTISTDAKLMRMVIENLLTNAVKYTPEEGSVTIRVKKKNTRRFIIEVQDTGYGIPKDQQAKIFTKLFRADNVRESDTDGTGLGLYLTKSIVDYAKGKISFTSKEGKGTTFTVELPFSGMKSKQGSKKIE